MNFIHISLAHFLSPEQESEHEIKESVLEGKILNQLLHQIPAPKIAQTRFKVKRFIDTKSIVTDTIGFIMLFVAILFQCFFKYWKSFVETFPDSSFKLLLSFSLSPYAIFLNGLLIVLLLSFILYDIISMQKNKNIFRKLTIQGNEFEIFEESDDSYFDKYLNEVLYLFENSDADVIVFEDMDRFNSNQIFERLREVNTLVNIQLEKNKKSTTLRFFYLLRDEIFVSKDRTKFFDYIIPVVPVVDSSNSYNQFIYLLKKSEIFNKFDEKFLQGLSLYIDDMRLLKNIYNEFQIYYSRLNTTELDCNKMLAIIAYKNLFPRDFADLQLNRGFVYKVFCSKDKLIESETNKLSNEILEKSKFIDIVKHEHLESIEEFNLIYEKEKSKYWNVPSEVSEKFQKRKQAIEIKVNGRIEQIEEEIKIIEKNQFSIKNKQLFELITRENVDSVFSITSTNEIGIKNDFSDIKSNEYFDLLKYLIRNGYIDETYADYMTYFYDNSLSRIDKVFLRSITDKKAKDYSYKLKNPKLVISYLKAADFDQEEILNFDLLTFLLKTKTPLEYLERFIDQLKTTRNFDFIGSYFDITAELQLYIEQLNIRWPQTFFIALNEKLLTAKQLHLFAIDTMYFSDDDTIILVNENNCLTNYISNESNFLNIDNPNIEQLIQRFKFMKVSFKSFNYEEINKLLFHRVYEESLYKINPENVTLIITEILNVKNRENILHKNYTLLCNNRDSAISKYVNENIDEYFNVILEMSEGEISDDEEVVVEVLNNSMSDNLKKKYISVLNTKITNIKEIKDSTLWPDLLNADIVQPSENNIIECVLEIKMIQSVISYINRIDVELDFSKSNYNDTEKKDFFDAVIKCMPIENSKYAKILVSLKLDLKSFLYVNIESDKMSILFSEGIIKMTSNNLVFIRENYPKQKFEFILKNIEEYMEIMSKDLFLKDEMLEILNCSISDEYKIKLLSFTDEPVSIIDKTYSSDVCLYILSNNLKQSEIFKLFLDYEKWEKDVQNEIIEIATQYVDQIIDRLLELPMTLKYDLLYSRTIEKRDRINLFISMMPNLNEDNIKGVFKLLDLSEYIKIFETHSRPRFEINDENKQILFALKQKGLICDYEESKDGFYDGYYKITRLRSKTK